MADFSGLGALDAAAWPVLDELTASTGENAASGIPTGGQAAAAMELDVGSLAADGDGPSSDWLEQLSQGVAEHPDLARLLGPTGWFKSCPSGRCSHGGQCLLRMAGMRYDWLVQQVREADRLRVATRAPDTFNMGRTHGGGARTGAQVQQNRDKARVASEAIGDAAVDAADYNFDDDDKHDDADAAEQSREDDNAFLGSKHEARVAREMFVLDLMSHMQDPDFLVTGEEKGVCTDSMLAVANVSRDYMRSGRIGRPSAYACRAARRDGL